MKGNEEGGAGTIEPRSRKLDQASYKEGKEQGKEGWEVRDRVARN